MKLVELEDGEHRHGRERVGGANEAARRASGQGNGSAAAGEVAVLTLASLASLPAPVLIEQDGNIVLCNDAAARLLGAAAASAVQGRPLAAFVDAEEGRRLADATSAPGRLRHALSLRLRRHDGDPVSVEVVPLPLQLRERPALQLVLREVPARERSGDGELPGSGGVPTPTGEQLRQAQKMDAVGRLASGIAHDFNNILTAIRGHAEILLEDLPEQMPAREDALGIQRAAERARDLTRQLLSFARGRPAEPVPLDVNATVDEVERLLRRLIRTDVGLHVDLQPEVPAVVGDPGQLQQVVLNLVVNASEAVGREGLIVIRTRSVRLREAAPEVGLEPGDYVQLCVSDNGPGMSDDVRRQLFEPFFTTKPEGTGLGLSTVYGIVKKWGGVVHVHSEVGRGTTFEVLFPARS